MNQAKVKYGVLLAHPTGNSNVRHAALALHEAGLLAGLHTTISWRPGTAFDRLLPGGLRAELARRSFPAISPALIHTHPFREMVRLLSIRMGWQTPIRHETGRFSIDAICAALDLQVAEQVRRGPALAGVYAYDDCALHSFQAAKQRGIACLYDLPIGHYRAYRQIAEDEQEARPEWAATL